MNNAKLLLVSLLLFSPLVADEVETLNELISATRKNLDGQLHAMELLQAFKEARAAFVADPESARKGTIMVRYGIELLEEIEKQRIAHLFPSDFVYELQFYNEVYRQPENRQAL